MKGGVEMIIKAVKIKKETPKGKAVVVSSW